MIELSGNELNLKLDEEHNAFAVFLYTPMCGTCKLTERMLLIIKEMKPDITLYKSNMNYLNDFAQHWQIQSIPCLLVMKDGELLYKLYAMKSLDYLYEKLAPLYI